MSYYYQMPPPSSPPPAGTARVQIVMNGILFWGIVFLGALLAGHPV